MMPFTKGEQGQEIPDKRAIPGLAGHTVLFMLQRTEGRHSSWFLERGGCGERELCPLLSGISKPQKSHPPPRGSPQNKYLSLSLLPKHTSVSPASVHLLKLTHWKLQIVILVQRAGEKSSRWVQRGKCKISSPILFHSSVIRLAIKVWHVGKQAQ